MEDRGTIPALHKLASLHRVGTLDLSGGPA